MNASDGVDARGANANPVLTIIITCYNTRDIVRDCLNSIYKHPPSDTYEITLVDDASTDGTSEMTRVTFPEIRLLRNEINQNYSSSNNRALDEARGGLIPKVIVTDRRGPSLACRWM
jgi:glycosyltransferase involved in cell wall biosynthesis